jgi:hypothetical protein
MDLFVANDTVQNFRSPRKTKLYVAASVISVGAETTLAKAAERIAAEPSQAAEERQASRKTNRPNKTPIGPLIGFAITNSVAQIDHRISRAVVIPCLHISMLSAISRRQKRYEQNSA